MGITTEQYKRIIRFLDGDMEPEEMDEFEKELSSNAEMRNQLDFEQSVRDEFALQNIQHLQEPAPGNGNMKMNATSGKIKPMRSWVAICAAVFLIAVVLFAIRWPKNRQTPGVVKINNTDTVHNKSVQLPAAEVIVAKDSNQSISPEVLYKQYFRKDVLPEEYPLYLADALMDYEAGKYSTLQRLNLNDLPSTRGTDEMNSTKNILKWGHYYKGLAYLQTNNTHDAIANLDWIINHQPGKELLTKAQWYLALAYLKESNRQKTIELCGEIVNNKNNNLLGKNAEEILDVLRN